ncbi:MAG: SGNH/GDSL hydrolase family protein, partial [Rhodothermales bacterium]
MLKHVEHDAVRSYVLPFLRIDRHIPWLQGASSPEALAAVTGLSLTELDQELGRLDENVRQTALEMLKEEDIPEWLPRLPFKQGERLLAFGDSTVDDRQGWFSILSRVLDVGIPDAEFTFLNAGTAWQTTSEALRRVQSDLIDKKPDWVFISIGMFDAIRLKALPDRTLVPLS